MVSSIYAADRFFVQIIDKLNVISYNEAKDY